MPQAFNRSVLSTVVILVLLGGVAALAQYGPRPSAEPGRLLMRGVRLLDEREPNRQAREDQTIGYYEAILGTNRNDTSAALRRLFGGGEAGPLTARVREYQVPRTDYLAFELPAGATVVNEEDRRFDLKTNRFGMADGEYEQARPARTRRIAVIGDSIAYGYGTPPGSSFEAVVEDRLNQALVAGPIDRIELLNFSVSGYRMTQLVEVGRERVPAFQPHVYMVTVTPLSLVRRWGHHVVTLLERNIDLKYPYLRQVVAEAGIAAGDTTEVMHAKLARFKTATLRWGLTELKAAAERSGATLVTVLIPSVNNPDITDEQFAGVKEMVEELGIPVVDLLDCFAGAPLDTIQVSAGDNHPNELGHELIADALMRRLGSDAAIKTALLGDAPLNVAGPQVTTGRR